MQELADTMLSQDMGSFHLAGIVFVIIILLLSLLIITRVYLAKKKENSHYKGYGYKISFVVLLLLFLMIVVNIGHIYRKGVDSDWYLTYGIASKKIEDFSTSDPGTRKTYYYVIVDSDKIKVTKNI